MNAYAKIRAALEQAGDYIRSDLASERGAFEGYEGVSRIDEIKVDLANNSAALAALAELEKAASEVVAWIIGKPTHGHDIGRYLVWNAGHVPHSVGGAAEPLYAAPPIPAASFQQQVKPWMLETFGVEISSDMLERSDRFIEEALELGQSLGHPKERAHALIEYVYGRPVGEPSQEVGGVMVTLAALCLAAGLDMHEAAEIELARIWTKIDVIREKQKSKPRGSALPVPTAPPVPAGMFTAEEMAESWICGNRDNCNLEESDTYKLIQERTK